MRTLRVAQKVYPDVTGGGPYHVHAMSRDQAAMGHDVTVLTVGDGPPRERRDGYTIVRKPAICEPLGNAISPGVANYLRNADDYDVVHAHSHLYSSTNLAALNRVVDDTPLAITNHGLYSQTAPEWVFDVYLRTLGRWTFDRADVVFCYTDADRTRVRDVGISAHIEVVSNGIDTERFCPDGPESDQLNADGPVLLFVGRLVDGKRPAVALEAFAALRKQFPDAELYYCGTGPLDDELANRAEGLGVREAVTFLGHVSYEEMPAVYRSADVLVLPSRAEGLPRTVLEAMASGVPVVASDLEQISTVVEEGGRTVALDGDFANAIANELLETNRSPTTVIDNGEYDWQNTVRRTTRALCALTDEPGA